MTIFRNKKTGLLYLVWQLFGWSRGYVAEPYNHSTPAKHTRGKPGIAATINMADYEPVGYR